MIVEIEIKPSHINCEDPFEDMMGNCETEKAAREIVLHCLKHGDNWEQRIPGSLIFAGVEKWLEKKDGDYFVTSSFISSLGQFTKKTF